MNNPLVTTTPQRRYDIAGIIIPADQMIFPRRIEPPVRDDHSPRQIGMEMEANEVAGIDRTESEDTTLDVAAELADLQPLSKCGQMAGKNLQVIKRTASGNEAATAFV